jgi:hypothetical protein
VQGLSTAPGFGPAPISASERGAKPTLGLAEKIRGLYFHGLANIEKWQEEAVERLWSGC